MKIPVCIFTHSGAALRLPWAVRGAHVAGLIPVVCQDGADPLPPHVLGWLESQGVEIRTTTFLRRGNLNGTDCAAGICREIEAACIRHGSSHAAKMDDDTAPVDPTIFTGNLQFAAVGLTCPVNGRPGAYGLAYCLSRETASQVAAALEAMPEVEESAPEDLTIWNLAAKLGECLELPFKPEGGPWSAILPGYDLPDALNRFAVLTVGNEPEGGWKDADREKARELRKIVMLLEGGHPRRGNGRGTLAAQIEG